MRNILLAIIIPLIALSFTGCLRGKKKAPEVKPVTKDYNRPLAPGEQALVEVDMANVPDLALTSDQRVQLQQAIANSLKYLNTGSSSLKYPVGSITKDRVVRTG